MSGTGLKTIFGKDDGQIFGRFNPKGEVLLYMQRELKEYRIVLTDREGKRILIPQVTQMLSGKFADWNDSKMFVLSDALYFLYNKRNGIVMRAVQEFGVGFFLGTMFQRLATNRGAKLEVTERTLTAAEMDEAIKETSK